MSETRRALAPAPKVPLQRVNAPDPAVRRMQKFIETATEKSRKDQHAKGVKVTVVTVIGDLIVNHKLGRKPKNVTIIGRRGAAVSMVEVSHNSRTSTLNFSAAGQTMDLWFY